MISGALCLVVWFMRGGGGGGLVVFFCSFDCEGEECGQGREDVEGIFGGNW